MAKQTSGKRFNYEEKTGTNTWNYKFDKKKIAAALNRNIFTVTRVDANLNEPKKGCESKILTYAEAVKGVEISALGRDSEVEISEINDNESLWKDDSGATDHCCKDRHLFTSFKECKVMLVTAGQNHRIQATGEGSIDFFDEDGDIQSIEHVLYVPDLRTNLFSRQWL